MDGVKCLKDFSDPDYFDKTKAAIEKDLSNLKKTVDSINQMRVEAAYLETDLMMTIDVSTWENISELIGLTAMKKKVEDDVWLQA